jgi:hypothetical protein
LLGKFKTYTNYIFYVFRGEIKLVPGFVQLGGQLFQLVTEFTLELEHTANRFGLLLSTGGVEVTAPPKHGFLDLTGNDRTNLAQIFPDGFDLEDCAHEKFQISFQIANLAGGADGIEALTDKVMNVNFTGFLTVAIHPAVALLHAVGVPGNLVVNEAGAVILQVHAFGSSVCCQQDAHSRVSGVGLERLP